jgi:predicted MFS family arabinose efflux permease
VIAGTFFICGLSTSGVVQQHFIPYCADWGVNQVTAASMLAMMGVFNFIGTILSGWLSDRFDNRILLAWYYGLRGLSLMWLPFSGFDMVSLTIFAVFFGLDFIATVPPTVKLAAQHFGAAKGPIIFGWAFAAHQLGGAVSALAAGMSRDALATYLPAFFAAGLSCMVAVVAVFLLHDIRKTRVVAAE